MTSRGVSDGVTGELPSSRARGDPLLLLFAFLRSPAACGCLWKCQMMLRKLSDEAVTEGLIHRCFAIYARPFSPAAAINDGSPPAHPGPACSPPGQPESATPLNSSRYQYCINGRHFFNVGIITTKEYCQVERICFYSKEKVVLPAQRHPPWTSGCKGGLAMGWVKPWGSLAG